MTAELEANAREWFGFAVRMPFEVGLPATIGWYESSRVAAS